MAIAPSDTRLQETNKLWFKFSKMLHVLPSIIRGRRARGPAVDSTVPMPVGPRRLEAKAIIAAVVFALVSSCLMHSLLVSGLVVNLASTATTAVAPQMLTTCDGLRCISISSSSIGSAGRRSGGILSQVEGVQRLRIGAGGRRGRRKRTTTTTTATMMTTYNPNDELRAIVQRKQHETKQLLAAHTATDDRLQASANASLGAGADADTSTNEGTNAHEALCTLCVLQS